MPRASLPVTARQENTDRLAQKKRGNKDREMFRHLQVSHAARHRTITGLDKDSITRRVVEAALAKWATCDPAKWATSGGNRPSRTECAIQSALIKCGLTHIPSTDKIKLDAIKDARARLITALDAGFHKAQQEERERVSHYYDDFCEDELDEPTDYDDYS